MPGTPKDLTTRFYFFGDEQETNSKKSACTTIANKINMFLAVATSRILSSLVFFP